MTTSKKKKRPGAKASEGRGDQSRNLILAAAVGLGVVGLGVLLWLGLRPEPPIEGVAVVARPARGHDADIVIPLGDIPPPGGVHRPEWQNCGVYEEPIAVEYALHSLEHGAVWIAYNPDALSDEQVADLRDKFLGQSYYLLSPYPGLRSPLVATAWGFQLEVNDASDERIDEFVERYRLGPTTPERGGACTGGVGEPLT
jgi:hypothetical protein